MINTAILNRLKKLNKNWSFDFMV